MLCISLLIVRFLTGASAYSGDLFDLDLDGLLTLVHCGAPAALARNKNDVVLSPSHLAKERGFVTVTCRPKLEKGAVTLFRFYGSDCDKMHLAAGELLECEQSPNLKVKIAIIGDRWDFLEQCFGNHYIVTAGDIRKEIKLLCKWLGITVFET